MKDCIFHPLTTAPYHTCQFMYRGFQISFTTLPPQEVVVFQSEESFIRLHQSSTVEEAIEWINNQ